MLIQYKLMAKVYDLLDVIYFRKNNPRNVIMHQIPNQKVKVLELCAGTASNSILIAKNNPNASIYGIDRSKEMLEIGLRKVMKAKIFNLQLKKRDAIQTGLPDESFDYIIISLVLHESSPEFAANLLKEAKRLLKPKGKLLILEWEQPRSLLKKLIFVPIMLLEPKGFKAFLQNDFNVYFKTQGLRLLKTTHCNYSRVFEVGKTLS